MEDGHNNQQEGGNPLILPGGAQCVEGNKEEESVAGTAWVNGTLWRWHHKGTPH